LRNLAVFLILIAAFFLLLTDRSGKGFRGGKGKPSAEQSTISDQNDNNETLSDEFKPQDLSKYSNIQKLNDDFDYRRSKLEYQLNEEVKEFIKDHDRYGKDAEAYNKMVKHHANLRKEFYDNRMKTLKNYQNGKTIGNGDGNGTNEEPINRDLR